jgi:hypothetical protein
MTEIEKALREIAEQIVADVEDAGKTGDLYLMYDRMVANAEDLRKQLNKTREVLPNE